MDSWVYDIRISAYWWGLYCRCLLWTRVPPKISNRQNIGPWKIKRWIKSCLCYTQYPHINGSLSVHCICTFYLLQYQISYTVNWVIVSLYNSLSLFRYQAINYCDVIMGAVASQITSLTIDYSILYSDADQRKHQSSASLAFVRGIHRGPVNSPHKWPVTRKMFPFDDVIMTWSKAVLVSTGQLHTRDTIQGKVNLNTKLSRRKRNGNCRCKMVLPLSMLQICQNDMLDDRGMDEDVTIYKHDSSEEKCIVKWSVVPLNVLPFQTSLRETLPNSRSNHRSHQKFLYNDIYDSVSISYFNKPIRILHNYGFRVIVNFGDCQRNATFSVCNS